MSLVFCIKTKASSINVSHAHDMYFRPVEADGNCLFRAASVALSGDFDLPRETEARHAKQLRSDVVDFMRRNRTSFESFLQDVDFDEYTKTMEADKQWGGEPELSAIARLHRRPVHVYTFTCDQYVPFSQYPAGSDGATDKIILLFHGRHYDALFESSE